MTGTALSRALLEVTLMANQPHKAEEKLQEWIDNITTTWGQSNPDYRLAEILYAASQDYAKCRSKSDRQAIYAVIVGALDTFSSVKNLPTEATKSLYDALVAVVNREKGADELEVIRPQALNFSAKKDSDRARLPFAHERHPNRKRK